MQDIIIPTSQSSVRWPIPVGLSSYTTPPVIQDENECTKKLKSLPESPERDAPTEAN